MKIYTKRGDDGTTGLIGGTRLPKHHLRIETYGTVDELNSFIGLLRDQEIKPHHREFLIAIQERLFTIGSHLASDPAKARMQLPEITDADVKTLEQEMDALDQHLPEMKNFVLPGGHVAVSTCHVCRSVCRRAERLCVALAENEAVENVVIKYLNRLSDYLFVLARTLVFDVNAVETPWAPRGKN